MLITLKEWVTNSLRFLSVIKKKKNLKRWIYNNPLKVEHFMVMLDTLWQENVLLLQYTILTAIILMALGFSHSY